MIVMSGTKTVILMEEDVLFFLTLLKKLVWFDQ